MPCEDSGMTCKYLDDLHNQLDAYGGITDKILPEPSEEDMHFVADGSTDERRGYLVLAFEWNTDDHTAPAGAVDIPLDIELESDDDIDFEDDGTHSLTYGTSESDRKNLIFPFVAGDGEIHVEYTITSFPGTQQEEVLSGTLTLAADDPPMDWTEALAAHWTLWALFLLVGLVVGVLIGRVWGSNP